MVVSVSGLTVSLNNTGDTGNAAPGFIVGAGAGVGPGGVGGSIGNAFTTTAANFTQPNVGANVNVQVVSSAWAVVGEVVFVGSGGYYTVFTIPDTTHLTLTNLGYPGNAAPAALVTSPKGVSPGGLQGPTGPAGVSTLNGISPTTTKGDLIVDNGANSPLASDVRLAAGTNGQILASDSTQPTGLGWKSAIPNAAATDGDIVVFNGTTGTPMAVKDSKLLITGTGAIQSTPTGGNARGTSAIDLQVVRVANTQVASGAKSALLGGENNTASGTDSVCTGGLSNQATNSSACVSGGESNVASGVDSSISGGNSNTASNSDASVCGGVSNIASGIASCVAGGNGNIAGATYSFCGGGQSNSAGGLGSSVLGQLNTVGVNGQAASIIGGTAAFANLYGEISHASGFFATGGDAQSSELLYRIQTPGNVATEMFLDGAALRAVVPLNTTWGFEIYVTARSSAGVSAVFEVLGGIQNNANTVSLVAGVTTTVVADGTGGSWGVAGAVVASADNVNKSLKISVTGAGATNIRWVARARLVEVGF